MCKVYDSIYELSKHAKSDVLICYLNHLKVEGHLHKCNSEFHGDKCYDGVVTLKDANIRCLKTETTKEFAWINIPSKQIQAFAFKCCEKE